MAVLGRAVIGRGSSAQGFYARRLRFGDLAFDIGANHGHHTAAMLKRGARVVALEPQADLARKVEHNSPAATVLALGVSDMPGQATLFTSSTFDQLATVNPAAESVHREADWDGEQTIRLTTLDDLIAEFGVPAFVKFDVEGLEDKVLAGLSQPVDQLLFEVRAGLSDVAARAFERLTALASYEYRVMRNDRTEAWVFGPPVNADVILADLPEWGDVYARRIDPTRA
jgi:FkbM family methyltransferase